METMRVKLTFTNEVLGGSPASRKVYEEFILSKALENGAIIPAQDMEEELNGIPADDKGKTVFMRDPEGHPCIMDYQIKGFFKDACSMLRKVKGSKCAAVKNYKKVIDGLVFPMPRFVPFQVEGDMGDCIRSLRADTMQGPRVTLANSESIPAGSTLEFDIVYLTDDVLGMIKECLDYGALRGLLQWRNSGKGTFIWEEAT